MIGIGGIINAFVGMFAKLAGAIGSLLSMVTPPGISLFIKYLKFCLKSSIVLIFFLMGGSLFMFIGIFYIYYVLYIKMSKRLEKEKLFYKPGSDLTENNI